MTKVSKNIKKLRTERNLTQEDISKELFVTRQTVSSWESGRTQPDLETIMKLSDLFGVSAEELIYGKLKTMSEEDKNNVSRQRLIIIFSVLGSVLTAVGLVLIFVNFWDRFPLFLKSVFAFVPLLAGQAAAVYTLKKHRESIPWREGAAVLWVAGVTAMIALMDSIHLLYTDFADCLIIDILLSLPVIYLLDAVSPLLFIHFGLNYLLYDNYNLFLTNILILALFAVASVCVITGRKKKDDIRQLFAQWISLISLTVILISDIFLSDVRNLSSWIILTVYFAAVCFLFNGTSFRLPHRTVGVIGIIGMSVLSVFDFHPELLWAPYFGYDTKEKFSMIVISLVGLFVVALICILKRKHIGERKTDLSLFISTACLVLSQALCCIIVPEGNHIILYILTLVSSLAAAISVIAEGVMSGNFFILNIGLIAVATDFVFVLVNIIDFNILLAGILLLVFGIALFTVNFLLAGKIKKGKGG